MFYGYLQKRPVRIQGKNYSHPDLFGLLSYNHF